MTIFCSLYIWWFWARFWRLLLLPNHPHGQLMPETRRSFVARLRSLINEFPVINMRLPGNAPWCSIVLRELCRGCRAKPWPGGNRISVRARLYDYTSCPEIRIVFHVQLRQIHPVAVATMGISKLRKLFSHLLPLWPWPPPVPGGGFFCCLSWRTTANFWRCKLQHIKHTKLTKLTKLTIAMSSLTPPCHIGGFFRLSWLSFADGYGRLEKSAFVVLSPK